MILRAALLLAGTLALTSGPAEAGRLHRLPTGYKWGRCLLVVDGQTRISGRCSYQNRKGGEFWISGPRQVFEGIDYRNPGRFGAGERSRDYWAVIYHDETGWWGYGNNDITGTHGDSVWKNFRREGACLVGTLDFGDPDTNNPDFPDPKDHPVRVCLWRK